MSYLAVYYVEVEDLADHCRLESVMRKAKFAFYGATEYMGGDCKTLEEVETKLEGK